MGEAKPGCLKPTSSPAGSAGADIARRAQPGLALGYFRAPQQAVLTAQPRGTDRGTEGRTEGQAAAAQLRSGLVDGNRSLATAGPNGARAPGRGHRGGGQRSRPPAAHLHGSGRAGVRAGAATAALGMSGSAAGQRRAQPLSPAAAAAAAVASAAAILSRRL